MQNVETYKHYRISKKSETCFECGELGLFRYTSIQHLKRAIARIVDNSRETQKTKGERLWINA
jgi:hypothetical protein